MVGEAILRRYAVNLAAQLPENVEDAAKVLTYCQEILRSFLTIRQPEVEQGDQPGRVVEMRATSSTASILRSK